MLESLLFILYLLSPCQKINETGNGVVHNIFGSALNWKVHTPQSIGSLNNETIKYNNCLVIIKYGFISHWFILICCISILFGVMRLDLHCIVWLFCKCVLIVRISSCIIKLWVVRCSANLIFLNCIRYTPSPPERFLLPHPHPLEFRLLCGRSY